MKKQQEEQRRQEADNIEKPSTPTKKKEGKINDFQALFTKVSKIVHELWLERNTDRHNPAQRQLRIAKITEAIREVEHLYSLQSMIMQERDSRYYVMELSDMTDQSYTYIL